MIDEKKQHFYIFTKIVEVSPKYILVNNTQRKLEISQENALKSFRISANERKPFYWKDNEKMKLMIIRLDESGVDWNWSGGIDVSIPKTFTFLIRGRPFSQSEKKDEISFFRVLIFKEKEIHYISIYCLQQEDYPYRLQNNCKNFTIAFKQIEEDLNVINKVSNNIPFVIMNNSSLPFAWPFPNKPSEIEISFFHQGLFDPIPFRINFNLTRLTHKIRKFQIPTRSLMYEIEAKYIVNGPTIILEFTDKNINIKQEEESEVVIKCFVLFFKEFGISLITKNKLQKNIELCYIYLKVKKLINFKSYFKVVINNFYRILSFYYLKRPIIRLFN